MNIGTVKWFNAKRGYGFIRPEDGSKDVIIHVSAVEPSDLGNLQEGQKLGYELEKSEQGKISAVSLQASSPTAAVRLGPQSEPSRRATCQNISLW
jgi:CspA family cold shock protein